MLYLFAIPVGLSIFCYLIASISLYQQLQERPLNRMPIIKTFTFMAIFLQTIFLIFCAAQMDEINVLLASYTTLFIDAFTVSAWVLSLLIVFFKFQEPIVDTGVFVFIINMLALCLCYADKIYLSLQQ